MECPSNRDLFCYICGEYTLSSQNKPLSATVKLAYKQYFGFDVQTEKDYAPSVCCAICYSNLLAWYSGNRKSMRFGVPMLWAPLEEHVKKNCYFCSVDTFGHNRKSKSILNYPADLPSAIRPKPHSETRPIPIRVETVVTQANVVNLAAPSTSNNASTTAPMFATPSFSDPSNDPFPDPGNLYLPFPAR